MSRMKFWIGMASALLLLAGCGSSGPGEVASAPVLAEVMYEVTGDVKSADITVETPTGTSQQSVSVPIMNKAGGRGLVFKMKPGSFAYLSAQNTDQYGSGPITCRILVNGTPVSENTSSGKFSIATCKGTV